MAPFSFSPNAVSKAKRSTRKVHRCRRCLPLPPNPSAGRPIGGLSISGTLVSPQLLTRISRPSDQPLLAKSKRLKEYLDRGRIRLHSSSSQEPLGATSRRRYDRAISRKGRRLCAAHARDRSVDSEEPCLPSNCRLRARVARRSREGQGLSPPASQGHVLASFPAFKELRRR